MLQFEELFFDVLTAESLLRKFYAASKKPDESLAASGCQSEHLLTSTIEKEKIPNSAKNDRLRSQSRGGMLNEQLKNACRHKYETITKLGQCYVAVRAVEQEIIRIPKKEDINKNTVSYDDRNSHL